MNTSIALTDLIRNMSDAEQGCLKLLLERAERGDPPVDLQSAAKVFQEVIRSWVLASHIGRVEQSGKPVTTKTFAEANEAWKNFPREFPREKESK